MNKITDLLAQDLYPIIFRNLSIQDLFNCRIVNKKFKYFSDNTDSLGRLIIGQPCFDEDYYWYYNNKLIDSEEIISLKCFRSIKLLSIFNLDKYLKYLKIYDNGLKLEELSNLINLESLEFGYALNYVFQQIINLNNLKVFVSNNLKIKLNTPKLEQIQFNDLNQIELDSNPESIKHLITRNYRNEFETFKNLEIIEVRNMNDSLNENLLIIFKNLKQLKILANYSNEEMMNGLIKILDHKMKLRREFDIYFQRVKIENIDKFNELKANVFTLWSFRLDNYDLLDLNLPFIDYLEYDELEECVNNIQNDLPSTFFDKFQNIHRVDVYKVNDVDGLNWFLNNLKYLTELRIDCGSRVSLDEVSVDIVSSDEASLGELSSDEVSLDEVSLNEISSEKVPSDEAFYNNLPSTIRYLCIWNDKEDINYDFILKLTKLCDFFTEANKDLFDLAFTSFLNLKYLRKFEFYFRTKNVLIEKRGKNFFLKYRFKKFELDYNQLIVQCNEIRSK